MQVDMSDYEPFVDDIEEYVNRQGATFGEDAEFINSIAFYIEYLYVHGIATEAQAQSMNNKLLKRIKKSIKAMEG